MIFVKHVGSLSNDIYICVQVYDIMEHQVQYLARPDGITGHNIFRRNIEIISALYRTAVQVSLHRPQD